MVSTSYAIDSNPKLRFGIVTDSHHADIYTKRSRYNRQSLAKMQECVDLIEKQKVGFLIELSDLKNQDNEPNEN